MKEEERKNRKKGALTFNNLPADRSTFISKKGSKGNLIILDSFILKGAFYFFLLFYKTAVKSCGKPRFPPDPQCLAANNPGSTVVGYHAGIPGAVDLPSDY